MIENHDVWLEMITKASPLVDQRVAEILYHRAAASWAYDQTLTIPNGMGGTVNLTEMFEQFRMYAILKGGQDGKSESNS